MKCRHLPLTNQMMKQIRISLIPLLLLALSATASAQITASGLWELQRGRVPGSDNSAISTIYQQFNVDYTNKSVQIGLRAEVFNT